MKLNTVLFACCLALGGCSVLSEKPTPERAEPSMAERHNALGLRLAAEGRHDEALGQFSAAVALSPQAAYLHNNLGFAYLRRGAYEQAIQSLEEAQRLDPAHPKVLRNLAIARERLMARRAAAQVLVERPKPAAPPPTAQGLLQIAPNVYELRWPATPAAVPSVMPPRREPVRRYRLEVANGNGVQGMARRVATRLSSQGLPPARTTNERPFNKRSTEVHYRPGYEAEALQIVSLLSGTVRAVPAETLASSMDVRVILGRDTAGATAIAAAGQ
jgi:hypothetical protein